MAMVSVVNWQPTGGLMFQADRLGPEVGGHQAPCCIHHVNQGELSQCFKHDDSTIKIVLALLLCIMYYYYYYYYHHHHHVYRQKFAAALHGIDNV